MAAACRHQAELKVSLALSVSSRQASFSRPPSGQELVQPVATLILQTDVVLLVLGLGEVG